MHYNVSSDKRWTVERMIVLLMCRESDGFVHEDDYTFVPGKQVRRETADWLVRAGCLWRDSYVLKLTNKGHDALARLKRYVVSCPNCEGYGYIVGVKNVVWEPMPSYETCETCWGLCYEVRGLPR